MLAVNNQLMNLCLPVFDAVNQLQSENAALLPPDFGQHLLQIMTSIDYLALEKQVPGHQINDSKYALAALLDEVIMKSDWPGKSNWMDQSLQLRLFGEHLAGVNFFDRLARLRQGGELNIPVLQLYFVCLQLGFQGKYALNQPEELKHLQNDLKNQIDLYQGGFNASLSSDLDKISDSSQDNKQRVPIWAWFAIVALVIGITYGVYGLRLNGLHDEHRLRMHQSISQVSSL
jgi:type VI secretion system protein ImpK